MQEVTIKYIAAKMKRLKEQGGSTILFLGAGASRSAGIPLASEIMDQIEKDKDLKIFIEQKCKKKSYAAYMDALSTGDRRRFFNKYIQVSNINTTHLYAAQLISEGYVDCVVTTNFDNLMLKSLTLLNMNPSVYDLTIARDNMTSNFEFPAVIYLHGQHHGFWQLNTEYELELPVNAIRNAITKISTTRAWVVIGYSGNDPVLNQLASIDNFAEDLFWVCYQNEDPPEKVRKLLLDIQIKGTNIIKGYNSDNFFRQLKNELGMDEPQIVRKPFTQLLNAISNIQPVVIDNKEVDLCTETRKWIQQAIKGFELREGFENKPEISKNQIEEDELLKKIKELYNSANYAEITNYEADIGKSNNPEIIKYHSYVYWDWGWSLGNVASEKSGKEKENGFLESIEKTKRAIEISPNETLYDNWAWALGELSELKSEDEKEKLLQEGIEKCKKAIEINPNFEKSINRWGWALGKIATLKTGQEKENLILESIEKRKRAIEINPKFELAYENLGWTLGELALLKIGSEKEKLLNESIKAYTKAIEINPESNLSHGNLGWVLGNLSKLKSGAEKERLLLQSIEERQKALAITPNDDLAYYNWGWALKELASMKTGDEKEKLLLESIEKRKKAVEINPKYALAFYDWGWTLGELASLKTGVEKENLLSEALDKYKQATEINPSYDIAYENWGWTLGELATLKSGEDKEKLLLQSIEKYKKAVELNPNSEISFNNWGSMLENLTPLKTDAEKEQLLLESIEKYKQAININPNYSLSYENWGLALKEIADLKSGDEKEKLLKESQEKYEKAKEISGG